MIKLNCSIITFLQIQYAKTNIESTTGKVTETFSTAQDKMTSVWSQIVTEEDESHEVPKVNDSD